MTITITPDMRDAIAHAVRDMQYHKLTWPKGYCELKAIWDKISSGEIHVSSEKAKTDLQIDEYRRVLKLLDSDHHLTWRGERIEYHVGKCIPCRKVEELQAKYPEEAMTEKRNDQPCIACGGLKHIKDALGDLDCPVCCKKRKCDCDGPVGYHAPGCHSQ